MSGKVIIRLDTKKYASPTQKDLDEAKAYIRERNNYAALLEGHILEILRNAAREITEICYKYNIDPVKFELSSNQQMYAEVTAVMDRIFDEIMNYIQEYSLMAADEKEVKDMLLQYIMSLGRQNRNLNDTLEDYMWRYLYDVEALIASMRIADVPVSEAMTKIATALLSVYTTPEVKAAFKVPGVEAMYLKSKGIHYHRGTHIASVGLSNSGAVNVINMAKITLAMAWWRKQSMDFANQGAVGYYQLRGSTYPCATCDGEVGFHRGGIEDAPYPHPHCCCYRVPIFRKEDIESFE